MKLQEWIHIFFQETRWKSEYFRLKREMLQVRQHQLLMGMRESAPSALISAG